jgi:hypothetical protein
MSGATSWAVVWIGQGSEGRTHHGSRELALNRASGTLRYGNGISL